MFLNDIKGYFQSSEILSQLKNMRANLIKIKTLLYDIEYNTNLVNNITKVNKLLDQSVKNTYEESERQEGLLSVESVIDPDLHMSLIELEEDVS